LHQQKAPSASVVEIPFSHENGDQLTNERDDDAVKDEAEAEQIENQSTRRIFCDGLDLRFGRHHGILPEPNFSRNAAAAL
jgi:hypothetical protein